MRLSGWLGREISVQWDEQYVRLLNPTTGLLLREHRRVPRNRHAVPPADPPRRTPPTTLTLLARAARAGRQVGILCDGIHRYLERQPSTALSLRQVGPLIRQLTHYRDGIADKT